MNNPELEAGRWATLVASIAALSEEARTDYVARLQMFAHDLRQPLSQIHSAEDLLRRGLKAGGERAELFELLDIIRSADKQAADLVTDFVKEFLQQIEASGGPPTSSG